MEEWMESVNEQTDFNKMTEKVLASDSWEDHMIMSPLRESLLNWYEFRKDADLLELSADYGQMTGLFCQRTAHVTAVTGENQMSFLKNRHKHRENLSFLKSTDAITEKYDYVIALDLIETSQDPGKQIREWMNYLRDDGILILSCQNRFGLKYFCGAADPYTGRSFDGINGYLKEAQRAVSESACFPMPEDQRSGNPEGRCLSHSELDAALETAGCNYKYFYPVPDSRMPQMIFTDQYQNGINAAERLIDYNYQDPNVFGVEHRIFRQMIDQGALPFLSNSFLVEISKNGRLSDMDYVVTTTDRGPLLGAATSIRSDGAVFKRPLWPEGTNNIRQLYEKTKELKSRGIPIVDMKLEKDEAGPYLSMPYIQAEGLSNVLTDMVQEDIRGFLHIFDQINEYNQMAADEEKAYIDLAPCNCFYLAGEETGRQLLFYDQEFTLAHAGPAFAMYRTIKYFYASARKAEQYFPESELYARYGITPEDRSLFEEQEQKFIESVRHGSRFQKMYQWGSPDYELMGKKQQLVTELSKTEKKPYRVGYVPGVFDLFHTGHLILLERCKARCDYLIVGVLTDELVEYYKGHSTVISYEDRARVIAGLKVVDKVVPVDFSNTDKLDAWNQLHYDCHFSGDDHINHWNDVWEELKKRGSNMEFFSYTQGISSTQIRGKLNK